MIDALRRRMNERINNSRLIIQNLKGALLTDEGYILTK
jgi:hypothetical protein